MGLAARLRKQFGKEVTIMTDDYKGVIFNWIEEWSQFFHRCNWRTFHFAHFEVEDDRILGAIEATLILLGLGFQVRWNYKTTEFAAHLRQLHDDVKSGKEPTYPLSEIDNEGQ
jgi:hypothetical protein